MPWAISVAAVVTWAIERWVRRVKYQVTPSASAAEVKSATTSEMSRAVANASLTCSASAAKRA